MYISPNVFSPWSALALLRRSASASARLRRGLPEFVDLLRVGVIDLAGDRPELDRLVAEVAVGAHRLRWHPDYRARRDLAHVVAEAHRQRAASDDVELLLLLVPVPGPLLEVRMGRDAHQSHRDLLSAERVGQRPKLAGNVAVGVGVVNFLRIDDRVVAHRGYPYPSGRHFHAGSARFLTALRRRIVTRTWTRVPTTPA